MFVYIPAMAVGEWKFVCVTGIIPDDAWTNVNRKNVVVPEYALYRTNKVRVLKIDDSNGRMYDQAKPHLFSLEKVIFRVGETLEVPCIQTPEVEWSNGLYFFLNRYVAERFYSPKTYENNYVEKWYYNGVKACDYLLLDGYPNGVYREWYENGQLSVQKTYRYRRLEGRARSWYMNGDICTDQTYLNGELLKTDSGESKQTTQ